DILQLVSNLAKWFEKWGSVVGRVNETLIVRRGAERQRDDADMQARSPANCCGILLTLD
ncbi:hypothetical protein J6590_103984, partial [Homalodisca vitripennis]